MHRCNKRIVKKNSPKTKKMPYRIIKNCPIKCLKRSIKIMQKNSKTCKKYHNKILIIAQNAYSIYGLTFWNARKNKTTLHHVPGPLRPVTYASYCVTIEYDMRSVVRLQYFNIRSRARNHREVSSYSQTICSQTHILIGSRARLEERERERVSHVVALCTYPPRRTRIYILITVMRAYIYLEIISGTRKMTTKFVVPRRRL